MNTKNQCPLARAGKLGLNGGRVSMRKQSIDAWYLEFLSLDP